MIYSLDDLKKAYFEGFRDGADRGDRHGDVFGIDGPSDAAIEKDWQALLRIHSSTVRTVGSYPINDGSNPSESTIYRDDFGVVLKACLNHQLVPSAWCFNCGGHPGYTGRGAAVAQAREHLKTLGNVVS